MQIRSLADTCRVAPGVELTRLRRLHAFTVQSEPLLHEVNVSHLLLEHGS